MGHLRAFRIWSSVASFGQDVVLTPDEVRSPPDDVGVGARAKAKIQVGSVLRQWSSGHCVKSTLRRAAMVISTCLLV